MEIRYYHYRLLQDCMANSQQSAPADEFQVKAINLMYNQEEDKFYCLLEAPNKQAIQDHHNKYGFKCEWITEVKTTA